MNIHRCIAPSKTVWLILALLWMQPACSLFRPGPGATVRRFYLAIGSARSDEALQCLHPRLRAQFGDNKLRLALAAAEEKIRQQHGGLSRVDITSEKIEGDRAQVESRITFRDGEHEGERDTLERFEQRWYLVLSK